MNEAGHADKELGLQASSSPAAGIFLVFKDGNKLRRLYICIAGTVEDSMETHVPVYVQGSSCWQGTVGPKRRYLQTRAEASK